MKKTNKQTISASEILSQALVSDKPEILRLARLSPEERAAVIAGRLRGLRPISVRWESGQYAILMCPVGTVMPSPVDVVNAYKACEKAKMIANGNGGGHD